MDTRTGLMAYQALCRIVEARTGIASIAIYERHGDGFALGFATDAYRSLMIGGQAAEVAGREAGTVDPATLGLNAALAIIEPLSTGGAEASPPGFIALASPRSRRAKPRFGAALRDAAIIGGELLRLRLIDEAAPGAPAGGALRVPPAIGPPAPHDASGDASRDILPPPASTPRPRRLGVAALSRAAVHELIASILRARSQGEPLALMLLDIDRFRAVNEALGTETGDLALSATGSRLESRLDARDRLIRLEGDRFLVVTSPARRSPRDLAEALLAAVGEPLTLPTRRIVLRASVGVVQAAAGETSPVRLLMQADSALRRAKLAGGNRIEIHEPGTHAAFLDRSLLELDLRHALEAGQLAMVYQPYVALETGRPVGAEALLRWTHPTRGEIAPATFIPLAEATGQILPIGLWALRRGCAEAARHRGSFQLSVNISPLQFHAPGFVEQVDAVLAETGFPADRLELEITETVLMRDNPETTAQLRALIARGIRIALDDFGTGYSALAYLSRLPHHRIKLDKSFVQDLDRPSTAGLIRAIIALARAGGIETTAEGVEHPDQLRAVQAAGFTHAQGFATGAPVPDLSGFCEGIDAR